MLLGLAFPNGDNNTTISDNPNQVNIENVQVTNDNGTSTVVSDGDTGGETADNPPKK